MAYDEQTAALLRSEASLELEVAALRADLAAAKAREKALRRFYDDFWFHAQPALGDWIVPANELEVADDEVKAAIAGSKT